MKSRLTIPFLTLMSIPLTLLAEPQAPIELWPDGAPAEAGVEIPAESSADKNNDGIIRISNVSIPTLTVYPAPADKATGAAVLVCPGGGYNILANSHEGTQVCEWLNSIGVTGVLLKYRVPRREGREKHEAALEDSQKAMQLIRKNAAEWKIDPTKVGILGFSAGGHLSIITCTALPKEDRPNFAIPIYPAYLKSETDPNALSPDIKITEEMPPFFVAVSQADKRFVEGSALLFLAAQRAKVESELHIYVKGRHGFGILDGEGPISDWPERAADWMKVMGIIGE